MQSQNELILKYLQTGRSITPLEALRLFGSFRLGARIFDLKSQGHDIHCRMVSNGEKRFASYSMSTDNASLSARVGL